MGRHKFGFKNARKGKATQPIIHSVLLLLFVLPYSMCQSVGYSENEILDSSEPGKHVLAFTQEVYEVVIPENSIGKVYAVPSDLNTKMGIALPSMLSNSISVRFRIKAGDEDHFFKAEAERVGDFVFLLIRTRTNSVDVLNRERRDAYELEIRTRVRDKDNRRLKMEATTIVRVRVKDVNDLDPFFQPSSYSFNVPEDTPLHQVNTFYFKHYNKFSGNFHWVCFCRPKAPDTTFFAMPHCTLDRHKNYPRPSGIIFLEK